MNYLQNETPEENRNYRGIVTLCSPHNGAEFLNIVKPAPGYSNGETPAGLFVDNAVKSLSKGPLKELIYENVPTFLVNLFKVDDEVIDLVGKLSGIVTTDILPAVFGGNSEPISDAYTPGAAQIVAMNNFGSLNIPSVAMWARESDPLIWRAVTWQTKEPSTFPAYQATDAVEEEFIDKIEYNTELYRLKMVAFDLLADHYCTTLQWLFTQNICNIHAQFFLTAFETLNEFANGNDTDPGDFTGDEARALANGYSKGYNWFLGADDHYKGLVGALEVQINYSCECEFEDQYGNGGQYTVEVNSEQQCLNEEDTYTMCNYSENGFTILSIEESDGSVLKSSALAFPGSSNNDANIADNAFHMQARNHPNLKAQLDKLLAGEMDNLQYFETN